MILVLNCLAQYANQATRIIYYTYELQDVAPGNIWSNVFFVASFGFAGIGGVWMLHEFGRVRKEHPPGTYAPGPVDMARTKYAEYKASRAGAQKKDDGEAIEEQGILAVTDPTYHYAHIWYAVQDVCDTIHRQTILYYCLLYDDANHTQ